MKNNMIPVLLILFLLFTGCKKNAVDNDVNLQVKDFADLKYGNHASQTMDMYLPENRGDQTKVIMFVHGGSWLNGDKNELTELAKIFRSKGYASASINYRLSHTVENYIHPAQVNDIALALQYISGKAQEWEISNDQIALFGVSAGGHLALLYTFANNSENKIKTVISLAGPANLLSLHNTSIQHAQAVQWFLGSSPQVNPPIYQQASPVNHVTALSKPTLLFHGKLDVVVPYEQSVSLKAKLDQFNVKNKLVSYENLGHEANLNAVPGLISECESWLAENLK